MQDLKYTIGLDLGISSVGWSVVEIEENEKTYFPKRLISAGVRAFNTAETPKEGNSLNLVRRESRSTRRRLNRRKLRLNQVKDIFRRIGFIDSDKELVNSIDPWQVRSEGLDRKISQIEIAIATLHIAKRRGFKSNRKFDPQDGGGKYAEFIKNNKQQIADQGYRTFGELLYKSPNYQHQKRNSSDSYLLMIDRDTLLEELDMILTKQRSYYPELTTDITDDILDIVSFQRPFAPGDTIEKMVGFCELEPDEKRAPVNSYSFELFRIYQFLNNLRLKDFETYTEATLSFEQKELVIDKLLKQATALSYKDVRKLLNINESIGFKDLGYIKAEERDARETSKKIPSFKGYHTLRKALKELPDSWKIFSTNQMLMDSIANVLTLYKSDEDIQEHLDRLDLDPEEINALLSVINFNKFGHISTKAIIKILPYLKQGLSYYDSCQEAGYTNVKNLQKTRKLPIININEVRNPVVLRSLTQTRKVVNAIIDKYGSPSYIHIELARDLGKPRKIRNEISKKQAENYEANSKVLQQLKDDFHLIDPSGKDILIFKLWKEQQEKCAYSQEAISAHRLFEPNYVQIDHALPFSRTLDDSYNNKVLVKTAENQNKGNMTPFEYLNGKSNSARWQQYKAYIESLHIWGKKRETLLSKEELKPIDAKNFLERDLNDTCYLSRYFKNFVEDNLIFRDSDISKRKVYTYNGRFTAQLRRRWGLEKSREESNRHHALDATVVAVASYGMVINITNYLQTYNNIDKVKIPYPWEGFYTDVKSRIFADDPLAILKENGIDELLYADIIDEIKPLFVSRPPRTKVTGQAHAASIYSPKMVQNGYFIKRKDVKKLKLSDLENIYGDDENIKTVLRDYLQKYPTEKNRLNYPQKIAKDDNGPLIKKVKIKEASNLYVSLNDNKGVAANGSMVRVDIFQKDKKYYLVPIYVHNLAGQQQLPMQTTGAKGKKKLLDETYEFKFSLYPDDYLELLTDNKKYEGYYVSTHSRQGTLSFINHDAPQKNLLISKGAMTVDKINKLQISVLGDKSYITSEKRKGTP